MAPTVMQQCRWFGAFGGLLAACGGGPAAPPESAPAAPAESAASAPAWSSLVARQPPQAAPGPEAGPAAGRPVEPKVLAPVASVQGFGKVIDVEEHQALWTVPAVRHTPPPRPQRYERWRQLKQINVGFSHLSTAELSDDDQYLLAVSENEARLRVYETKSGKLLSNSAVARYEQYGRGAFMWQPGTVPQPAVLFAHDGGIEALQPATGATLRHLADEPAWELRGSSDGAVLGASLANIDRQTSVLVFYAWRPDGGGLAPALALRFTERVDGFDLSADKSLLAVSYYPSDTVELLDLRARQLVWSQRAPKYVSSVDISPDGAFLAVGGGAVVVYDVRAPSRQSRFTELGNNVHQVRFSPAGDALAASAYDGKARILLPAADGSPLKLLKLLKHAGTANVYAVSFSATGDRLVTSSGDKTLRIWGE